VKSESKGWLLLIVLACIWGSSFILMKKAMYTSNGETIFTDPQVGALRMLFASAVLLPFGISTLRQIKSVKLFISLAIVGFFGNFFPAFLFTYAETGISSGFTGMLNSFTPIFTVIIGFTIFKVRLNALQISGVVIGTLGIYLLMSSGLDISKTGSWKHVGAVVLATLCYAISLNTIKHTLQSIKPLQITSLAFLIILLPALFMSFHFDTLNTIKNNPNAADGLIALIILSVIGTALAVILFNRLISVTSALFASSVTYFIPIVAVLIGIYFKESMSFTQVCAMFVILIGVLFVNYSQGILSLLKKKGE
jgi:drug/metabolite transporter (DMT)-like permease